jgi:probable F420-dependent oxidoreductase
MASYGLTVPLSSVPLLEHRSVVDELRELGYSELWSAETDGADGFTPLVLGAAWSNEMRLGTAIIPAFTRGPALIAMSAASLASIAPGRVSLGIGSSSNVIVERWNGIEFDEPFKRTRDVVRFLRDALGGERVQREFDTFAIDGFRLSLVPEVKPQLLVAALRPQMLAMAGREADGAILNWLSADDATKVVPIVGAGKTIVARVFVCPTTDDAAARALGRRMIAAYLNVPVYREFHRWLGRESQLRPMWDLWAAGDRGAALASIPDEVVDDLLIHGDGPSCKRQIDRYFASGVDVVAVALVGAGVSDLEALRVLGPMR